MPDRDNPYAITPVVTPIIPLNGDRKHVLLGALGTAYSAVQDAIAALAQGAPNARNYYPEPGRMEKAMEQYYRRCEYLDAVLESLDAECAQIEEANPTRR